MPVFYQIVKEKLGRTLLLEDEDGNQVVGVIVGSEQIFTADENDIRQGKVAATNEGVTEGKKVIPSYHTTQGFRFIPAGDTFYLPLSDQDAYDFTELQALMCRFNGSLAGSVAAEKVSIAGAVYPVASTEVLATVVKDAENKAIQFGITNNEDVPFILRYFTYKEVY